MNTSASPAGLTPLEADVLRLLIQAHPDQGRALEAQLAVAVIASRRQTGVGFFLNFSVGAAPPIDPPNCELNDVYAEVPGLEASIGFLLFVRKGKIDFLEGHTHGEAWPDRLSDYSIAIRSPNRGRPH